MLALTRMSMGVLHAHQLPHGPQIVVRHLVHLGLWKEHTNTRAVLAVARVVASVVAAWWRGGQATGCVCAHSTHVHAWVCVIRRCAGAEGACAASQPRRRRPAVVNLHVVVHCMLPALPAAPCILCLLSHDVKGPAANSHKLGSGLRNADAGLV